MKLHLYLSIIVTILILKSQLVAQGPYAPPAGQTGSTAIFKDSSVFVAWATNVVVERGWQNSSDTTLGKTTAGNDSSAIGKSGVNGTVSLGDGGSAILTFNAPIKNGAGADFAVFENSFDGQFLELAFVEVSSDGVNFFRFPAHSLTQDTIQLDNNANMDATYVHNLAGKYRAQYGTPFDLDDVDGATGLDVNNITHVKIIDVIGSINPTFGTYDNENNIINDPFPTPFPTGGFDLDAVGVIHSLSTSTFENKDIVQKIFPNPVLDMLTIIFTNNQVSTYQITDISGKEVSFVTINELQVTINTASFKKGIYFLTIVTTDNQKSIHKIVKQ